MPNTKPTIAITVGDPNGVGYELIRQVLEDERILEMCHPVVYGNVRHLGVKADIVDCYPYFELTPGQATEDGGHASFLCLERACCDLQEGRVDALLTAPINKDAIQSPSFHFPGHTEYLSSRFAEDGEGLMMLVSGRLRVALVCNHTPIAHVAEQVTPERIMAKLRVLNHTLQRDFSIRRPRIAVLALNPHAGDNGLIGREEIDIIRPTIDKANEEGISVWGPYSADGFFGSGHYRHFDAVLAMYHDQGLAPFKTLDMAGVNYTAGLTVVRTSPDHGTAYDLVGTGQADPGSMRNALYLALDVLRTRRENDLLSSHPLPFEQKDNREDRRPRREFIDFKTTTGGNNSITDK